MSNRLMMWAAALVTMGAVAQATGPSVGVSVNPSNGAVTVSPTTVVVAATDTTVTWTLTDKGYRFATSGGVSVPASAGYGCSNQTGNMTVVCTRSARQPGSFAYTLNLVPTGGGQPAQPTPNVWIQND